MYNRIVEPTIKCTCNECGEKWETLIPSDFAFEAYAIERDSRMIRPGGRYLNEIESLTDQDAVIARVDNLLLQTMRQKINSEQCLKCKCTNISVEVKKAFYNDVGLHIGDCSKEEFYDALTAFEYLNWIEKDEKARQIKRFITVVCMIMPITIPILYIKYANDPEAWMLFDKNPVLTPIKIWIGFIVGMIALTQIANILSSIF